MGKNFRSNLYAIAVMLFGPLGLLAQADVRIDSILSIPTLTANQVKKWDKVQNKQYGVMGSDFDGKDEIGTAPTQREFTEKVLDKSVWDFWYPNRRAQDNGKAYKQTLVGKMTKAKQADIELVFLDKDLGIRLKPNPDFAFILTESSKPLETPLTRASVAILGGKPGKVLWDAIEEVVPGTSETKLCPDKFSSLEAEVTLKEDYYDKQLTYIVNTDLKDDNAVGVYGPWIADHGHCAKPEIHPAEQIWWRHTKNDVVSYKCHLICDYSNRFMYYSELSNNGTKIKPWAEPELDGIFAFPFEVDLTNSKSVIYQLNSLSSNNAKLGYDKFKVHHLKFNGKTLVSVYEPFEDIVKITFEEVGRDPSGKIKGFVTVRCRVGKFINNDSKQPGHYFFEVKKTVKDPQKYAGKYRVTLEKISCIQADDTKGTEELFGSINVEAVRSNFDNDWDGLQLKAAKSNVTEGLGSCANAPNALWCLDCARGKELILGNGSGKAINNFRDFIFDGNGYFTFQSGIDENDSDNCKDIDWLGYDQNSTIFLGELGSSPYRFIHFFASGGTKASWPFKKSNPGSKIEAHFRIEKITDNPPQPQVRSLWMQLDGSSGKDLAVDKSGISYLVNKSGEIYQLSGSNWRQIVGSDGEAIAANNNKVCLINKKGKIFQLVTGSWKLLPGSDAKDIAVDSDGLMWMVNNKGKIYRFSGTSWQQMPGSDGARIAAGSGQIWLLNTKGDIYRFNGRTWQKMVGSDGRDISVSHDGTVFLTNSEGRVYKWAGTYWHMIEGTNAVNLACNNGKVLMVNTDGLIYQYEY